VPAGESFPERLLTLNGRAPESPPQRAQPQQQQLLQQQRRAVAELCGTTLRECAPLLLRGMESLEDAPLEDAAAATRAAVAFLRLGHHVHVQEHPEAPSARSIAAGALGLFKLRRSHRHADLLRLQALLLPLLPSLLAARPIAELMPILRDATRTLPWTDRPTGEPLLLKGLRDAKAAQTLSAYLTATAVLRYQPATLRLMLCELMATPCVLKGMDTAILDLLRARCVRLGGLHTMMRAQLPWLIAWWLDRGFPLVTFPHHWLTESGRSTPVERTESGHVRIDGPSGRDEPLKGFYQSHCLRLLPALLERAFAPGDSAVAKRAAAERGPLSDCLGCRSRSCFGGESPMERT